MSPRIPVLFCCLAGLFASLDATHAADPAPTRVVIAHAQLPAGPDQVQLPGTIDAWQETRIYARTDGYVRHWHADIGDHVAAGDSLVEIDAPEVDQAAAAAVAAVAQAQANLELARVSYERWQALLDRQMVSAHEVDERRATLAARNADLRAAQANVDRLRELQGFKQVTAPFAGTVTMRNVEHGALVQGGSGAAAVELYRVAETDRLRIRVRVPQSRLRAVEAGLDATVLVAEFPGRQFAGKVVRTAGAIDPASRTLLTEIELPNPQGELLPGLYAEVRLSLPAAAGMVLVPANAVRIDAAGAHVATVDDRNIVQLKRVTLGRNLGTRIEILTGLRPETPVILNPTDLLQDGVMVEVTESAAPAA